MFVTIKFVNLPGPQSSGKYGSIVTTDGTKIMVPADMLGMFRSGMSCEIATKEQTWGSTPVVVATSGPGGIAQGHQPQQRQQGGQQYAGAQQPNTGFQPKVYQGGGGVTGPSQNPSTDQGRHIFVTGCVGRAMGSGKFAASELPVLTQAACEAYDKVLTAPPKPAADPELNDSVQDL